MYESMYYSARDTNDNEDPDTLVKRVLQFQPDTTPIVIFNYDFLKILDTAFVTQGYLDLDTVNNQYYDHSSPIGDPYHEREVFAAGMPEDDQLFVNGYFRVGPDFIKWGPLNAFKSNTGAYDLEIDFDDGNGYVIFDHSVGSYHHVTFPDTGEYHIKVRLVEKTTREEVNSCVMLKRVVNANQYVAPDATINLPGINAGVYNACADGPQKGGGQKVRDLLEGFRCHGLCAPLATIYVGYLYRHAQK